MISFLVRSALRNLRSFNRGKCMLWVSHAACMYIYANAGRDLQDTEMHSFFNNGTHISHNILNFSHYKSRCSDVAEVEGDNGKSHSSFEAQLHTQAACKH